MAKSDCEARCVCCPWAAAFLGASQAHPSPSGFGFAANYDSYASEHGIRYRVYVDGVPVMDQPFAPGVPGFVSMTQA